MKVVTTNLLNRFWKNGIKPIKEALTGKVDSSKIVNSLLATEAGFALDARQGKVLDDKLTELNGKLSSYIIAKRLSKQYTAPANSTADADISLETISGYTPIMAVLIKTGNSNVLCPVHELIGNNTVSCKLRNISGSSVNATISIYVIYTKS